LAQGEPEENNVGKKHAESHWMGKKRHKMFSGRCPWAVGGQTIEANGDAEPRGGCRPEKKGGYALKIRRRRDEKCRRLERKKRAQEEGQL